MNENILLNIFLWWSTFFTLTVFFIPIISKFVKDRGLVLYNYSKVISFMTFGFVYWVVLFIYEAKVLFVFITLLLVLITSYYRYKKEVSSLYKTIKIRQVIFSEVLFLLSAFLYVIFKGFNPKVESIEKIMDQAILNTLVFQNKMPAIDVWYSSETFNYYYFGHFLYATFIKLLNTPIFINYNLSMSFLFALTVISVFSTSFLFTKKYFLAFISTITLVMGANLNYLIHKVILKSDSYFYADARSLVEHTINEFPAYSFLIGDLHAHIINIPFAVVFIGLLLYFYKSKNTNYTLLVFLALVLGSFLAINSWDFIIYSGLLITVFTVKLVKSKHKGKCILNLLFIFTLILLFYSPFLLNFNSPTQGVGFNLNFSPPKKIFEMFGLFLVLGGLSLLVLLKNKTKNLFFIFVTLFAIFLILLPEYVFIKDLYFKANPPYFRANTVFKVWYQAFIIFSCLTGLFLKTLQKSVFKYAIPIFLAIILINAHYSIYSVKYIVNSYGHKQGTLNGFEYLNKEHKDYLNVINYLNTSYKKPTIVLEAPGDAYKVQSIVSAYTGNPTVIGWVNHQWGWRGDWNKISGVVSEVQQIYTATNTQEALSLLKKYNVDLVVIGKNERQKYGADAGLLLIENYKVLYKSNDTYLVKVTY